MGLGLFVRQERAFETWCSVASVRTAFKTTTVASVFTAKIRPSLRDRTSSGRKEGENLIGQRIMKFWYSEQITFLFSVRGTAGRPTGHDFPPPSNPFVSASVLDPEEGPSSGAPVIPADNLYAEFKLSEIRRRGRDRQKRWKLKRERQSPELLTSPRKVHSFFLRGTQLFRKK